MVPAHSSAPSMSFRPRGDVRGTAKIRVGTVPRESVCTENLTPWKKLLPSKQNGLVHLLNPLKIYSSLYHSIGFHLFKVKKNNQYTWKLELSAFAVFDVNMRTRKLDWSFAELFGRDVATSSLVAHTSKIRVHLDRTNMQVKPTSYEVVEDNFGRWAVFDTLSVNMPFSLGVYYDDEWSPTETKAEVVSVSSALGGVDQFMGTHHLRVINPTDMSQHVLLMQQMPWYMQVSYHTLALRCNGIKYPDVPYNVKVVNRSFTPAISRQAPALLEMALVLPPRADCRLTIDFQKAFLRLREYPPDANHGMYVPAAVLTLSDSDNTRIYSNLLLLTLPVPDFSMPFNVICLVATTLSLCFGPIHSFSTKLLIPTNMALPQTSTSRRLFRAAIMVLIVLTLYAQYREMGMNEIRRAIEDFFERMNNI